MIHLEPYKFSHFDDLNSYQLMPEQAKYTRQPWQWSDGTTLLLEAGMTGVTILLDSKAVGFFVLDRSHNKFAYTDNKQAILLRSFSINPLYQGQGVARQSIQPDLIDRIIYNISPHYNEIVLAVNPQNIRAYHLYRNAGFQYGGRIIIRRHAINSVLQRSIRFV